MQGQDDHFYVQRTFTLPKTSKITEEVVQQLDHLLDYSSPEEYRNTLIEIYHVYMMHEYHSLPYEFERMASHLYFLIDFLKRAGEEMKGGEVREDFLEEELVLYKTIGKICGDVQYGKEAGDCQLKLASLEVNDIHIFESAALYNMCIC